MYTLGVHGISTRAQDYKTTGEGQGDESWSIQKFEKGLKIKVIRMSENEMEFDMIGVSPAVANCFRRIMLAEVPSMAFEKVHMYNNTSIIPDEVLAHRLGLIPLKANPRLFDYRQPGDETGTEMDTLEFELKVKCSWNPKKPQGSSDPDEMYLNHKVYTNMIKWIPRGSQGETYTLADVGPVQGDILIAKLRPGHEIDLKLHAVKGVGSDHAKFSPVSTAFYRLLPDIQIKEPIENELAERFQKCFSPGVIKLVESKGKKVAKVHNARYDSCSRNVLRYEDLAEKVTLSRVKDHFIFTIESSAGLPPKDVFVESTKVLIGKCKKFIDEINKGIKTS